MKKSAWLYAIPPVVCLAVFWRMPFIWFRTDDFAWLGLPLQVHDLSSLLGALFHPEAQGTVRVLGDRVPFLALASIFGTWAAPFRALTLLTWFGALILSAAIGTRISGSRIAGVAGAALWTAGYAVVIPLVWASGYDQILCAFLLLAALYGRMRWLDSGGSKWRVLEWSAYLLGFGALEITVMYPVAALLYTGSVARRKDRAALALLLPAAIFAILHFALIPKNGSDIYRIIVDARLPVTALRYVKVALGPAGGVFPKAVQLMLALVAAVELSGFMVRRMMRREWAGLFCVGWFAIFLVPVLPLPNHFSVYYLTLPLAGLSWLAGWGLAAAWRSSQAVRIGAVALAALFLADSVSAIQGETAWWLDRTSHMRLLIRGVEQEADEHPGTALILKDVDQELFQTGFQDDPFRLSGISRVYLAPGSEAAIQGREDLGGVARFRISSGGALQLIESGQARVLDVTAGAPRDITAGFGRALAAEAMGGNPGLVEVGNPAYASRLGAGWYQPENGFRWSGKTASVTLAAPPEAARLSVTGYGAPTALAEGPVTLRFRANGRDMGLCAVSRAGEKFTCDLALPAQRNSPLEISVETSRSFRPAGDSRDLGMVFVAFEVK